jgi:hypothetical protein
MPDATPTPKFSKARVVAGAAIDALIDILLPTAIYTLLAPTHLPGVIRFTIGGYFVAAKAGAGHVSSDDPGDDATSVTPARGAEGETRGSNAAFVRMFAFGAAIAAGATAVTLGVRAAGYSDAAAIAAGTVLLALVQGVRVLRGHRKVDGFALLVLLELAATIILTSISNTPRFILIRPSFYTAIGGFYVLSTIWAERPLMMQVTKPMAAEGDPVRAAAFERAGRESVRFRRAEQGMTAGLGIVLLGEAILRVVTVWSHPESNMLVTSLWSQAWGVGLFVVYFIVIKLACIPVASREVDRFMPAPQYPAQQAS